MWTIFQRHIRHLQIQCQERITRNMGIPMDARLVVYNTVCFLIGSDNEFMSTHACVLGCSIAGNANGHCSTFISSEHSRSSEWRYLAGFGWARHPDASYDRCCLPFALLKVYWKLCDAPDIAELLLLHEAISCTQVRSSLGTFQNVRFCSCISSEVKLLTIHLHSFSVVIGL